MITSGTVKSIFILFYLYPVIICHFSLKTQILHPLIIAPDTCAEK